MDNGGCKKAMRGTSLEFLVERRRHGTEEQAPLSPERHLSSHFRSRLLILRTRSRLKTSGLPPDVLMLADA
ncbi:UNVERIFIED_CONTAM: hypothetical protein Slati_4527300 [Sesamum latifolium]|uniref:Uncharacterized protein n=1 Tax=Sesamum latifolium TaxID=2727402 RepID=A0AAW2SIZ7_9LAMI